MAGEAAPELLTAMAEETKQLAKVQEPAQPGVGSAAAVGWFFGGCCQRGGNGFFLVEQ